MRSAFSLALGPAGGSLEYELEEALAEGRRCRSLMKEAMEEAGQWERAFLDAERERRRLEAVVKDMEKAGRLIGLAHEEARS